MWREKLAVSGNMSQFKQGSTKSEWSEVIHELRMKNIFLHGPLSDNEQSLDQPR